MTCDVILNIDQFEVHFLGLDHRLHKASRIQWVVLEHRVSLFAADIESDGQCSSTYSTVKRLTSVIANSRGALHPTMRPCSR